MNRYRVIVPYTKLHPVTRSVLDSYDLPRLEYVSCGSSDQAYRQLLQTIWEQGETVVLVEHDVVPWPGAIEELAGCSGLWCACTYRINGGIGIFHGLGCTKISGALMQQLPNLWDEPGEWSVLDQRLWFAAREIRQEPHGHRPPVIHLSETALKP